MAVTATPALPADVTLTLFVALELSRSTWIVALHSPVADKVSQHRVEGGDVEALLALIVQRQKQAETKLGQPVRVACCFEAGYDGFWLHRWLCTRGIENRVLEQPACWWIAAPGGPRQTGSMPPGSCAR